MWSKLIHELKNSNYSFLQCKLKVQQVHLNLLLNIILTSQWLALNNKFIYKK